jgi:hypothetical protein
MNKFKNHPVFQWHTLVGFLLMWVLTACPQQPQIPADNTPVETAATATNGLTGDYYDNIDFTGTKKTRVDATVNKTFGTAAPITGVAATTYSVRWTGQIQPQYTGVYTFYVTSADGAQLSINGQTLSHNWNDHVTTTDSGIVNLIAGIKYDIRLEYYRNSVHPGSIKLEWQSANQVKQVVPSSRLFSTGSRISDGLAFLAALPQIQARNLQFDPLKSRGRLESDYFITSMPKNLSNELILARTKTNLQGIDSLLEVTYFTNSLQIKDLLNDKLILIQNPQSYFDTSGNISGTNKDKLAELIAPLFLPKSVPIAPLSSRNPQVAPQGINVGQPCVDCDQARRDLLLNIRLKVVEGGLEVFLRTAVPLSPPSTSVVGQLATGFCQQFCAATEPTPGASIIPSIDTTSQYITPVIDAYIKCVFKFCPPRLISEQAIPAKLFAQNGVPFTIEVSFSNISSAVPDLEYTATVVSGFTTVTFSVSSGGSGFVKPGQSASVKIQGTCTSLNGKTTGDAIVFLKSNDPIRPEVQVAISVECSTTINIIVDSSKIVAYFDRLDAASTTRIAAVDSVGNYADVNWSWTTPGVTANPLFAGVFTDYNVRNPNGFYSGRVGTYMVKASLKNDPTVSAAALITVVNRSFAGLAMGKIDRVDVDWSGSGKINPPDLYPQRCTGTVHYQIATLVDGNHSLTLDNLNQNGVVQLDILYPYYEIKWDRVIQDGSCPNEIDEQQVQDRLSSLLTQVSDQWKAKILPGVAFQNQRISFAGDCKTLWSFWHYSSGCYLVDLVPPTN